MLEIKNPYALKKGCVGITDIGEPRVMQEIAFNQGATTYHEAVVKWLWGECTEHPDAFMIFEGIEKWTGQVLKTTQEITAPDAPSNPDE